jgi:hypothetical protein
VADGFVVQYLDYSWDEPRADAEQRVLPYLAPDLASHWDPPRLTPDQIGRQERAFVTTVQAGQPRSNGKGGLGYVVVATLHVQSDGGETVSQRPVAVVLSRQGTEWKVAAVNTS